MNKTQLIETLLQRHGWLREDDARDVVDSLLDIIGDTLAAGGKVVVSGFGTFATRTHDARVMDNPRGGEPIDVQSGRVPTFRSGSRLRRQVQLPIRTWPVHR